MYADRAVNARLRSKRHVFWQLIAILAVAGAFVTRAHAQLPALHLRTSRESPNESVCLVTLQDGVRVYVNAPSNAKADHPRELFVFAVPNGNTLEETLGAVLPDAEMWRYDIQHVLAQVRLYRDGCTESSVTLAVVEAPKLSWPAYRQSTPDANHRIGLIVDALTDQLQADRVILSGHSGGGSFLFGYIDSRDTIDPHVMRFVFLDANYAYSDTLSHGDKLLRWLNDDACHRLSVIAYDDREITLNGKKVVGEAGGTFRACKRMLFRLQRELALFETQENSFQIVRGLDSRIVFRIHMNPENKILHTALVGEMNGLLQGLTEDGSSVHAWGQFGGPRAYQQYVPAQPIIDPRWTDDQQMKDMPTKEWKLPPRANDAQSASQLAAKISELKLEEREHRLLQEVQAGNVPDRIRQLRPIRLSRSATNAQATNTPATNEHGDSDSQPVVVAWIMPDYVAVGSNTDFIRIPVTPMFASKLASATGTRLITAKLSDDIWAASDVKLEPHPLTQDREKFATFVQHHQLIENQVRPILEKRRFAPDDSSWIISGIKKDVVDSKLLQRDKSNEKNKVAIYGWHHRNGRPIQPLYVGHAATYVDYSHGLRLMSDSVLVDGKELTFDQAWALPQLRSFLSDE